MNKLIRINCLTISVPEQNRNIGISHDHVVWILFDASWQDIILPVFLMFLFIGWEIDIVLLLRMIRTDQFLQ